MTTRDKENIRLLYNVHRYNQVAIARLYGVTRQRIKEIIIEIHVVVIGNTDSCILCDFAEAKPYYIDGNENNDKIQNVIVLCESCKRRIEHMHLSKRGALLKAKF